VLIPGGVFIAPILLIAFLIWAVVRYSRARSGTV
jgi:flagellar biogenesis protein FliO